MGFLHWLNGLLGQGSPQQRPVAFRAPLQPDPLDELEGLNFRKAVEAHQRWNNRIGDYITGKNSERLDASEFAQVDQCILGVWMLRYGNERYGQEKLYQNLRLAHSQLHLQASRILTEFHKGNRPYAQEMLNVGEYPLLAMRLAGLLARLYHRCQDGVK